jgi:hypothetical protein
MQGRVVGCEPSQTQSLVKIELYSVTGSSNLSMIKIDAGDSGEHSLKTPEEHTMLKD